ncbi:MAG: hypothetical protein R2834_10160 [Rhodothermales bacterium]
MATKAKQPDEPAAPRAVEDGGMGELEKVRSILFGEQIRAYESRLAQVEGVLNGRIDALRGDMMERFDAMEASIKALAGRLEERLDGEGAQRAGSDAERRAEIAEVGNRLQAAEETLGQRLDAVAQEHREALKARADALMDTLTARVNELSHNLQHTHTQLDANKIDRVQLAAFMNQLADQLKGGAADGA